MLSNGQGKAYRRQAMQAAHEHANTSANVHDAATVADEDSQDLESRRDVLDSVDSLPGTAPKRVKTDVIGPATDGTHDSTASLRRPVVIMQEEGPYPGLTDITRKQMLKVHSQGRDVILKKTYEMTPWDGEAVRNAILASSGFYGEGLFLL